MAPEQLATLASETDFDGFRDAARRLLQQAVEPDRVTWSVAGSAAPELLAAAAPAPDLPLLENQPALRVPPEFVALCSQVVLHADRTRFALLYRLLWRLQKNRTLHDDPLDADTALARRMAHAVTHEMHKMKAFVRFRPLPAADGGEPLHVAWFEPVHHVVDAVAPFSCAASPACAGRS